jgi:hypothetical protein
MVHITNGDCVGDTLRRWAGEPRLIVWHDTLHEGPVRQGLPFASLSAERQEWLTAEGYGPISFAQRDKACARLAPRDSVWLWFEDDLYDQLQLLQILDFLHAEGLTSSDHYLIPIPRPLPLEQMAAMAAAKQKVTPEMIDTAVRAWAAFRSPDPRAIPDLLDSADLTALPDLRPAFIRLREHSPAPPFGLNRTERAIVMFLESGGMTATDLFVETQRLEERPFLGDTTFYWYLNHLSPLVQRDESGIYRLHSGLRPSPRSRWVGGVLFNH